MKSVNEGAVTTIKQIDGQFTCFVDSPNLLAYFTCVMKTGVNEALCFEEQTES